MNESTYKLLERIARSSDPFLIDKLSFREFFTVFRWMSFKYVHVNRYMNLELTDNGRAFWERCQLTQSVHKMNRDLHGDDDIGIIERMHDCLLDNHKYDINCSLLKDARELVGRIRNEVPKSNADEYLHRFNPWLCVHSFAGIQMDRIPVGAIIQARKAVDYGDMDASLIESLSKVDYGWWMCGKLCDFVLGDDGCWVPVYEKDKGEDISDYGLYIDLGSLN
jgi:hypothetical protein